MDRQVTSPTWGLLPPRKQVLTYPHQHGKVKSYHKHCICNIILMDEIVK